MIEGPPFPEDSVHKIVDYASLLDEALSVLLQNELQCGNKILEVAMDWPDTGSVFVLLKRRFVGHYQHDTFKYTEINDPHYWFAEYSTNHRPLHSVCCRWDEPLGV
ncbi:hypothetical protein SAMN04487996_102350 [Dyadobacter soli]|uniref:Uncharacterized protein n=1 Tax=Dyadobacter soli TaxID=659014 RepID=A0A1G6Y4Z7_9BACT|nr:hypothetical protein [Dyadobacter soli]SDD85440.1 hypothetical protein SAMN04487996_102350 [Dyadobacter soli]